MAKHERFTKISEGVGSICRCEGGKTLLVDADCCEGFEELSRRTADVVRSQTSLYSDSHS